MPNGENNILKCNPGEKSMKITYIIYDDFNDPKKSSKTKISKHTPSGFSLFTYWSFDKTKNNPGYYRGKDYMKVLCKI